MNNGGNNILVSVIVPVYNAEDYIEQCLESIINQTLKDIELILVDDSSTDDSCAIIQKYIEDNSLKDITLLINDKNMGAGYSRNRGLDIARGKYLVFLDSDDIFEPIMVEKLYQKCEETGADIAICDFYSLDNETKKVTENVMALNYPFESDVFKMADIHNFAFQYVNEIAWNKIFRRKFVIDSKVRFQCQHNANDQYFVFACLLKAKCIARIEEFLLTYRYNVKNHLSTSINKNPACIWNATYETYKYINELEQYELYKGSFNTYSVNRLIFSLCKINDEQRRALFDFYQNEGFDKLQLNNCNADDFAIPYTYAKYKWLVQPNLKDILCEPYLREINWNSPQIDDLFKKLQKVNNVVLWGVGVNGYTFLQKSLDYNLNIKNVIDCNESKVGVNVLGYVINDKSSLENSDFVVATNPFHIQMIQGEALHQIKKIEILDARAYLCFDIGFEQAVVNYQQNV